MNHKLFFFLLLYFPLCFANAKQYEVKSPDGRIKATIEVSEITTYSITYDKEEIISSSPISMYLDNGYELGKNMVVQKVYRKTVDEMLSPIIRQKSARIRNHFNELVLQSKKYSLHIKVFDDGVAYRFSTDFNKPVKVISEEATFQFAKNYDVLFPEERSILSAQQPIFNHYKLHDIKTDKFCSTPVLVKLDSLKRVLITESDLESYPGMFLKKQGERELVGKYAHFSLEEKPLKGRVNFPTKRANYIAKTEGKRNYPWRVIIIAEDDKQLISSQMVYNLAPESTEDYSWVRPGKIAWDWWNANNLYGVDFKSGINTETYKYYIDFASKYGIEYIVIDDGWSEEWDVTKPIKEMNIQELSNYAKQKNVGIILWVSWVPFEQKMKEAFEQYKKWGIKGLKVDFMNRDDQRMIDFFYTVAKEAQKYKMLVDFHGAYKPTGWLRTFPNVLTSEGVAGLENHKWSNKITPTHNLNLPFTRMVAGPMDYTPGAMQNFHAKDFKIWFDLPASIGTRCHQLAMYVVYESPLQMLSDSPSNYYREPKCMEFLSKVPVVWDETKILEAQVGEYILVARRNGNTWYIGGMAGDKSVDFNIPLNFISENSTIEIWEDGVNVNRQARDFTYKKREIKKGDTLNIKMYTGGGFVAIINSK